MTNNSKTEGMNIASLQKRADTLQRVMDALKTMEIENIPINFLSVFKFTGVSRSWLYKESQVRELISKAKDRSNNKLMQDQAIQLKNKGARNRDSYQTK